MSNPLVIAIVSAGGAFVGALLSVFIAPLIQHSFWKRQQLADLRRATITDLNKIMSEYITDYMDHQNRSVSYNPSKAFFESLQVVDMQIRVLFPKAFQTYKELNVMIVHGGPPRPVHEFIGAQEAALRAMYKEAGFI